jgi:hypothetical protein
LSQDKLIPIDCPICTPLDSPEDDCVIILANKCEKENCPDFIGCWATKHLEPRIFTEKNFVQMIRQAK